MCRPLRAGDGCLLLRHTTIASPAPRTTIDQIVVEKAARKLSIFRDGRQLKTYRVALGPRPIGPKEKEGDMKTPEGIYRSTAGMRKAAFISRCTFRIRQMMIARRAAERGVSGRF